MGGDPCRSEWPLLRIPHVSDDGSVIGVQGRWGVRGDPIGLLSKQRRCDSVIAPDHGCV